jgi:protocatechuate 3,4-dioxygenase beta subunit
MEAHDRGLAYDLGTLLDRRRALKVLAGVGVLAVTGCGSDGGSQAAREPSTSNPSPPPTTAAPAAGGATAAGDCEPIPRETAGPFPADGSNGPDALTESGVVRRDITSSFGSASGTARGVPLTINLTILDDSKGCAALANAAVYLWQCDMDGRYSLYSSGVTNQNYLRGVQEAGGDGVLTFQSVFPGAYPGRWPHIHFEVYPSLTAATGAGSKLATSQIALPQDACQEVYGTDGYGASLRTLAGSSLTRDGVFRDDGGVRQLATVTGDVTSGLVANLAVPV